MEQALWRGQKEHRNIRENATNKQAPLRYGVAARGAIRCVVSTVGLLRHRRIRLPSEHLGMCLRFADGTSARVYRETVVTGRVPADPCVLVVEFRLRVVRGWGHALFRWESLLNTPLFVGFPGFVSKLWLAHEVFRPSRALILHPRTLEMLRPLGVTEALVARADMAPEVRLHLGPRVIPVHLAELALADTAFPHRSGT